MYNDVCLVSVRFTLLLVLSRVMGWKGTDVVIISCVCGSEYSSMSLPAVGDPTVPLLGGNKKYANERIV
jgi:hypothetical protein